MTKLLLVTPADPARSVGGREQLSALHEACLRDILGASLHVHRLQPSPPVGAKGLLGALAGRIDGATIDAEGEIIALLHSGGFHRVWLDGSNLGRLAAAIKRERPSVQISTFCHNVEARFFLGSLKHSPGPRSTAILLANFAAERLATKYSDDLIALSERDSALFHRLYGRGASAIIPLAIDDWGKTARIDEASTRGLLFVGGAFYANLAGIRWFAANVAPHLSEITFVIGRGFEAHRAELEASGGIEVLGTVDDLAPHYGLARAVIAPIFDGSGMKTKVAEALMFGKRIIGTREAFSGYEEVQELAGTKAQTAADWIEAINQLSSGTQRAFDPQLRALYEQRYSRDAARQRIASVIGG